jgi:excisionase family DNA binding protein
MGDVLRGTSGPEVVREVDPDEALTVAQCAELAHVHPQTIRKAIRAGELPATRRREGAHPRVRRGDFTAWLYAEPVDVDEPALEVPAPRPRRRAPRRGSVEALRAIEEERRSAAR